MEVQNEPFEHKPCHANANGHCSRRLPGTRYVVITHNQVNEQRGNGHEFKDAQDGLNVFQCVFPNPRTTKKCRPKNAAL